MLTFVGAAAETWHLGGLGHWCFSAGQQKLSEVGRCSHPTLMALCDFIICQPAFTVCFCEVNDVNVKGEVNRGVPSTADTAYFHLSLPEGLFRSLF